MLGVETVSSLSSILPSTPLVIIFSALSVAHVAEYILQLSRWSCLFLGVSNYSMKYRAGKLMNNNQSKILGLQLSRKVSGFLSQNYWLLEISHFQAYTWLTFLTERHVTGE